MAFDARTCRAARFFLAPLKVASVMILVKRMMVRVTHVRTMMLLLITHCQST